MFEKALASEREAIINRVDSLKLHFESIQMEKDKAITAALAAAKEAVTAALVSSEKAVDKAELNAEKWRLNANEWRGAMNDREKLFVSTPEYAVWKNAVDVSLADINRKLNLSAGKGLERREGFGYAVGAVGIIAALVAIWYQVN